VTDQIQVEPVIMTLGTKHKELI